MADFQSTSPESSGKRTLASSLTTPSSLASSLPTPSSFATPSSASGSVQWISYEVFINYYGPDVKKSLASNLCHFLQCEGLRVFLEPDQELQWAASLQDQIHRAIRSASVHIAIFSNNYAYSPFCLDNLVLMIKTNAKFFPLFYHAHPVEVRWCEGAYGDAFREHESKSRYSKEKITEWKEALFNASLRKGWKLDEHNDDEGKLWKNIVDTVLAEVERRSTLEAADRFEREDVVKIVKWGEFGKTDSDNSATNSLLLPRTGLEEMGGDSGKLLEVLNELHKVRLELQHLQSVLEQKRFAQIHAKQNDEFAGSELEVMGESGKLLKVLNELHKVRLELQRLQFEQSVLSYEHLTEDAQQAFLDISSFFNGWKWDTVASIVGERELYTLEEKALVKRVYDEVKLSDSAIVIRPYLGKGVRISSTEELSSVLELEQNLDEIKGIWLMDNKVRFELPAEKLDQMHRSLRVLALGDWTVIKGTSNNRFQSLRFLQAGNVPYLPFNIVNLDQLRFLENGCGQEMGFSAAENISPTLRELELCQRPYCAGFEITSLTILKLRRLRSLKLKEFDGLRSLKLKEFDGLRRLPEEFPVLSGLRRLDLIRCSLLQFPKYLRQLNELEHLNVNWCGGLKELPESIGQLQCLRTLNLQFCTKLSQIPESFGLLKLLRILKLKGCRSLQKLPECLGRLSCLEDLNLSGCSKITLLPSTFDRLSSLRALNLKKCQNLLHLPANIGRLHLNFFKMQKCSKLRRLPRSMGQLTYLRHSNMSMNGCFALKEFPEELCDLNYMERLDWSCCTSLERLPDRFKEFASLRHLNMEMCENMVKLPEGFGKLSSLQELDLNSCIRLKELSGDFEGLLSLEKLNLSNCESLESEWMDTVVKIKSLKLVDITESWKLTERWTEIRSEANEYDMFVKFYQAEEEVMSKVASMVFSDECLLFDAYGCEIRPSTLVPNTTLVFVFERHVSKDRWKQLVENIKALHNTSLDLRIIHITNYTPNLTSSDNRVQCMAEPKGTILSLSFKNTALLSAFQRMLSGVVGSTDLQGDYVVTTTVGANKRGTKHFSRWKNISGLLNQINFKTETHLHIEKQLETTQENNLGLLRALLLTEGRDFLLHKDTAQVKIDALKGLELVLLLISRIEIFEIEVSILKEMYTTLRNNQYEFEVVWMPIVNLDDNDTWGSYVRAASSMPWLAVADPWSMNPAVLELVKQDWDFGHDSSSILVAVDEKGRISNKDAMGMVWRWGVEAYPFAGDALDDLLGSEWEQLNKKSSVEFLFQNQDSLSTVVKETVLHGRMIWLYGGDPLEIPDFTPVLNIGLRELDTCNIQIIYIGGASFPSAIELMNRQETIFHENNRQCISWPSLPFSDTLRFWRRVECLWWETRDKGGHEMFIRLRKLLVALLSLNNISHGLPEASMWIVAMDENGEMVTARGKDVINCLVLNNASPSAKELETREELIEGSRRGELTQVIKKRFQDGVIITSQDHPQHPFLPFTTECYPWPGVICDVCDKEIMAELAFFKCTICEDMNICEACLPGLTYHP